MWTLNLTIQYLEERRGIPFKKMFVNILLREVMPMVEG